MQNPNRPSVRSRTERIVTGAGIGIGIGILVDLAQKGILGIHDPFIHPLEDYLYFPTRFALIGGAFGLGKADFDKNGKTDAVPKILFATIALGTTLDVGETIADKLFYPNYPMDPFSLFLSASVGMGIGLGAGINYLMGRKSW